MGIYSTPQIEVSDELDRVKKLVFLFSCHRKANGEVQNILRERLIFLLSLYIMYGYSVETKEMAVKILKVKMAAIHSMNLELRKNDYLVRDMMNTKINHLHEDLQVLSDYISSKEGTPLYLLFTIVND